MLEKHEILCGISDGFDWSGFIKGSPSKKLNILKEAVEFILGIEDGADRVLTIARQLMAAFALSVPSPEAMKIRDDVGFFQAVKAQLAKIRGGPGDPTDRDLDTAIKQLVSKSVATDEVIDIFKKAGLDKPELSILDDAFLDQFKDMPQKSSPSKCSAASLATKSAKEAKKNLVMSRSFAQLLEEAIRKYQTFTLEAAAIIAELLKMAKDLKASLNRVQTRPQRSRTGLLRCPWHERQRSRRPGRHHPQSYRARPGQGVRKSVTIDWTIKEAVRAKIRSMVKRISGTTTTRPTSRSRLPRPSWPKPSSSAPTGRATAPHVPHGTHRRRSQHCAASPTARTQRISTKCSAAAYLPFSASTLPAAGAHRAIFGMGTKTYSYLPADTTRSPCKLNGEPAHPPAKGYAER